MYQPNQIPEHGNGAIDASDIDDEELRLLVATHEGPETGNVVMRTIGGEVIASVGITFDHRKIGAMLNPDDNRGFAQTEEVLYKDLSNEQAAILKQIQDAIDDPEIDLF